jgi:hypothetical protein
MERYEDVLRENDHLRRQLGGKHDEQANLGVDGKYKWTPKASMRRAWEELDERESTQATARNRSTGQRSGGSSVRNVRYSDGEDSLEATNTGNRSSRKISDNSVSGRKSSAGHSVNFEKTEEIIKVPVTGAMRPSRSRVSTPFFNEETVNKMTSQKGPSVGIDSSDDVGSDRHSSVNFEREVHVVEVPFGDTEHHSRSVRGRIATPFIRDIPTKEAPQDSTPEEVETPTPPN